MKFLDVVSHMERGGVAIHESWPGYKFTILVDKVGDETRRQLMYSDFVTPGWSVFDEYISCSGGGWSIVQSEVKFVEGERFYSDVNGVFRHEFFEWLCLAKSFAPMKKFYVQVDSFHPDIEALSPSAQDLLAELFRECVGESYGSAFRVFRERFKSAHAFSQFLHPLFEFFRLEE